MIPCFSGKEQERGPDRRARFRESKHAAEILGLTAKPPPMITTQCIFGQTKQADLISVFDKMVVRQLKCKIAISSNGYIPLIFSRNFAWQMITISTKKAQMGDLSERKISYLEAPSRHAPHSHRSATFPTTQRNFQLSARLEQVKGLSMFSH
jgi:hypothetical protein